MAKKILIIDDEAQLVEAVKMRLVANNYEVVTAFDGEEALEKAIAQNPNLIISDILMPKMDGYTFIKKVRANQALKDIPVIMLTGKTKMQDLFTIEGVTDYLIKPFEPEILLEKIKELVGE